MTRHETKDYLIVRSFAPEAAHEIIERAEVAYDLTSLITINHQPALLMAVFKRKPTTTAHAKVSELAKRDKPRP